MTGSYLGHVRTLPPGLQLLWAIEMVDTDIVKDGLAQVIETSDVQLLPDAVEAFQQIGSPGHAAVLERAVEMVFGKPLGQARLHPVDDMTGEVAEALEGLEEEYHGKPAVADELTAFIRKIRNLYVVT